MTHTTPRAMIVSLPILLDGFGTQLSIVAVTSCFDVALNSTLNANQIFTQNPYIPLLTLTLTLTPSPTPSHGTEHMPLFACVHMYLGVCVCECVCVNKAKIIVNSISLLNFPAQFASLSIICNTGAQSTPPLSRVRVCSCVWAYLHTVCVVSLYI